MAKPTGSKKLRIKIKKAFIIIQNNLLLHNFTSKRTDLAACNLLKKC